VFPCKLGRAKLGRFDSAHLAIDAELLETGKKLLAKSNLNERLKL
jgi:hypothetical protein